MSEHHDAALARASLTMAAATRGDIDGVIFHSDRGGEYTADIYAKACHRLGVIQSMGRVGSALTPSRPRAPASAPAPRPGPGMPAGGGWCGRPPAPAGTGPAGSAVAAPS